MRLCGVGTIFYGLNLTLTLTVLLPSMNLALNRYRAISRKISFAENLCNLALIQPGESRSDEAVQEHISAALIGPPRISSDYLVKEAEEEMDFADALTSFNQPPLTKTDLLLEKELLGRPISLRESDYTPLLPHFLFTSPILTLPYGLFVGLVFPKTTRSSKTSGWKRAHPFAYSTWT